MNMGSKNILGEPDRVLKFEVEWQDDAGQLRRNNGWRVQYNNKLGPYKGGLRFHPSVNEEILTSLAYEQVLKNSLTGLDLGGAKGGSDFDPKGKSEAEVKRFCEAFMGQLCPYIGPDKDVPAGDIGVGAREITYMYKKYVELTGKHDCALTGKPLELGGSLVRKEATGYGLVYFAAEHLKSAGQSFDGKHVLVSGSGNVATYAAEKATALGATVLTMSDSDGFVLDEQGIDVELIKQIKEVDRGRIFEYVKLKPNAQYFAGTRPWDVAADIALPCATQNEIEATDAQNLAKNGVTLVCEGSNLSTTDEAFAILQDAGITYFPGKASNAGGVAVSGLEMIQNARDEHWDFETVDAKLRDIMTSIHHNITETAREHNLINDYPTAATVTALKRLSQ